MPSTLDLCEKYYGTRDIYALMGIPNDALEKDGKSLKKTKFIMPYDMIYRIVRLYILPIVFQLKKLTTNYRFKFTRIVYRMNRKTLLRKSSKFCPLSIRY